MKYCGIVRDLANKQGNWRWYDEQFRFLRPSKPKSFPWDNVHWELWFQSLPISQSSAHLMLAHNPVKLRTAASAPFPKGFCWEFASREFCGAANLNKAVTNVPVLTEHRNAPQVISVQNHSALLAARQTPQSQTSHPQRTPRLVTQLRLTVCNIIYLATLLLNNSIFQTVLHMASPSSALFCNLVS